MNIRTRMLEAAALALVVAAGGTIAFMVVEDFSFLDALYITVITVSTVGFSEPAGGFSSGGQVTAIIVIFLGVGTVLYAATTALEFAIEDILGGRFQERRERRRVDKMREHTIVCGYGRIGRNLHRYLERAGRTCVVIESDEMALDQAREAGVAVVEGDATDDEVLISAGLEHASCLVASVEDDPSNLTIVLSARAQRPDLRIVARANEQQTEPKLRLAGADRVVTPTVVGAERMAQMAMETDIADFVDIELDGGLLELQVEQTTLSNGSRLIGTTLATSGIREGSGAMVVAVVPTGGERLLNPDAAVELNEGDALIVMGTAEQIAAFRALHR